MNEVVYRSSLLVIKWGQGLRCAAPPALSEPRPTAAHALWWGCAHEFFIIRPYRATHPKYRWALKLARWFSCSHWTCAFNGFLRFWRAPCFGEQVQNGDRDSGSSEWSVRMFRVIVGCPWAFQVQLISSNNLPLDAFPVEHTLGLKSSRNKWAIGSESRAFLLSVEIILQMSLLTAGMAQNKHRSICK